jgi:hypothetical protein
MMNEKEKGGKKRKRRKKKEKTVLYKTTSNIEFSNCLVTLGFEKYLYISQDPVQNFRSTPTSIL